MGLTFCIFPRLRFPKNSALKFISPSMASATYKPSETSIVTKIHRFLDEKGGFIHKYLMFTDSSQVSLASFLAVGLLLTDEQYNDLLYMLTKAKFPPLGVIYNFQVSSNSDQFGCILAGARYKHKLSDPGNRIPHENRNPANIDQVQGENDNDADNVAGQADNTGQNEAGNEGNTNAAVTGEDGDEGGGGGGANDDQNQRMIIYRYELNGQDLRINLEELIYSNVIADDCQNWDDLAQNILTVWRQREQGRTAYVINNVTPANCWPRAETIFGHRSHGLFQSLNWRSINNFGGMRRHINSLLVIENVNGFAENGVAHSNRESEDNNVIIGGGRLIMTYLYEFRHECMEMNLKDQFILISENGAFESWFDVAREFHRICLVINRLEPVEIEAQEVDAANCWPGADTIFGCWVNDRFQSLNWPNYEWEDVKDQLNCLLLIQYQ